MFICLSKRSISVVCLLVAGGLVATMLPACGGGAGGAAAGRGLILMSFSQDSIDNAVLNQRLRFNFSEAVNPATISNASIQIREGGQFGLTVPGLFSTQGSTVIFEPVLASLCDQSDSGFKPDTEYRVQVIGFPEEFSIRNMAGQSLANTSTYQFHTRVDTDPTKYEDQIPGVGPTVVSTSPVDGAANVPVVAGNTIHVILSENIDPCTINDETVLVHLYESGDPITGFPADTAPTNPLVWGGGTAGTTSYAGAPRRILCDIAMHQDFNEVHLHLTPLLGFHPDPAKNASRFPENALVVVQLTFDIKDYGQQPMTPLIFAFTTQNLASQTAQYRIENKGETPYLKSLTTAAVHPDPRAPERVQAYMLFAGDGDNGANPLIPSQPNAAPACAFPLQSNNDSKDDFDPSGDVLLDTGASFNTCQNSTDGSTAVVWEFNTFHIRSGITVRVVGANPAIILVQGDAIIDNGGTLKARGTSASVNGQGATGGVRQSGNGNGLTDRPGGKGVAGGGNGGIAEHGNQNARYSDDGNPGFGSPDFDPSMPRISPATNNLPLPPTGSGASGQPAKANSSSPWDGQGQGGGGGGHAIAGSDGDASSGNTWSLTLTKRGWGGGVYEGQYPSGPDNTGDKMQRPEAGSGGGGGGLSTPRPFTTSSSYACAAGAGGAGGGFVDLTSSGEIQIFGTLDAGGGRGGPGASWSIYTNSTGGGGGSGGGLRLLTPNDIILGATSVVSTAGGSGGAGAGTHSNVNDGGDGGTGRVVMETGSSVVTGLGAAVVIPGEGQPGFYRGQFDATRFKGGGLSPQAVTDLIVLGNYAGFNPTFLEPTQSYGSQEDFKCGIPVAATPGPGVTAIMVEARGYQMLADGTAGAGSQYVTVGYFRDSGVETQPTWFIGHPGDVTVPTDNAGGAGGFGELNALAAGDGFEFLQFRFTMFLPSSVGPFDAGAYLDDWTIRFTHDQ